MLYPDNKDVYNSREEIMASCSPRPYMHFSVEDNSNTYVPVITLQVYPALKCLDTKQTAMTQWMSCSSSIFNRFR